MLLALYFVFHCLNLTLTFCAINITLNFECFREVSITDVTSIEKRLMQTMDMIVMKKKRIAISRRQALESNEYGRRKQGLWGMLYSVGSDRNHESM